MNNGYKERLMKLMDSKKYRQMKLDELKKHLNIRTKKQERELEQTLIDCEKSGDIVTWDREYYNTPKNLKLIVGNVVSGSNKYLFVEDINTKEEIFISPQFARGALNGDLVLVIPKKAKQLDRKAEGKIIRILNRSGKNFVGTYLVEGSETFVEITDRKMSGKFLVKPFPNAVNGHKVLVRPNTEEFKIIEIIGHKDEPHTELLSLLYKYGISPNFNQDTLDQANSISEKVDPLEINRRKDFRNEMVITIDGEDAKDLDDAIHLNRLPNGNFVLGVHIADVSHYVQEGTPLDKEASERGTSVYLVNRVVPMLPQRLSNGICSLNPNVDRLTLTCEMEFTPYGDLVNYNFYESVINTVERMTYKKVYELINNIDSDENKKYDYLLPMIKDMHNLSKILRKKRTEQGSIDFDLPEPKIIVDENNKPIDILVRERTESEKLIEDFMLAANQTVATHFFNAELPFVYRIHELPKEDKIIFLSTFLNRLGYKANLIPDEIKPKNVQEMMNKIQGQNGEQAIKTLTLRMMNKAKYSIENKGHFGLAFKNYTHFTSPIRRYPDLLVHRLMRTYFFNEETTKKKTEYFSRKLPGLCEQSSKMERMAIEAERELQETKKAEYMSERIGEIYEGKISSITNFGFFVALDNTVEGLILAEKLEDDYYVFDEENYVLRGKRNEKTFEIGQKVKIKVTSCDIERQYIDFELVD